ncbi:hypothetical protein [Pseudoduganella chitinolytica]|uniref:Uncharacterized protein n=1 Tax=Pseudoduganella chitinolytica TaxID=34070 RepID=A0ABY8B9A3_9BURK|nr:hypothetical protein [Pseudoduganella chitinolytica]WEF30939.1 hypothetical protein PX653_15830 [Pseudoduganella chitinolytica]
MTMLTFKIYRNDNEESATGFDLGDVEFSFDGKIVSSRGHPQLSHMIYVSLVDLIDGLLQLKGGKKRYEYVGADSSFNLHFNKNKSGVDILHEKRKYGPISLEKLLEAVDSGIDSFLADPRNELSTDSSIYDDFNSSRKALKNSLS